MGHESKDGHFVELGLQFVNDMCRWFEWGFKGVLGVGVGVPTLASHGEGVSSILC